mmetsp:Transcript_5009/g.10068  ORF Transcript_5009/g.10068 Transcript_5009/m.10068 type:complete len:345 (-) Transcript_5009:422-1456(-)
MTVPQTSMAPKTTTSHDDDDDDELLKEIRTACRFESASNLFFVLGATLYLCCAVRDYQFATFASTVDDRSRLDADDDYSWNAFKNETGFEDDYVFGVPLQNRTADAPSEYWVSSYQMIAFSAALCLFVTGIVDAMYATVERDEDYKTLWSKCFGGGGDPYRGGTTTLVSRISSILLPLQWAAAFLTIGASLGMVSAMLDHTPGPSAWCNFVSLHFYALEGSILLGGGKRRIGGGLSPGQYSVASSLLWFGNVGFLVGTLVDIVLSYLYLFPQFLFSVKITVWEVFAQSLWLSCALSWTAMTAFNFIVRRGKVVASASDNKDGTTYDFQKSGGTFDTVEDEKLDP